MTQREEFEAWWEEFSSAHEDWRFADSDALRWATWQAAKQAQPERAPLSDAEIEDLRGEANRGYCIDKGAYFKAFRDAEQAHGIKQGGQHD